MEDLVVIGAGIVGLATAREVLRRRPGAAVLVLEKADDIASAQTGHNSGVIHAGLYYAPGSLKARLCRAGQRATKEFCDEHAIPYKTIGKLVVATDEVEVARMERLAVRGAENGIELERIDGGRLAEMEPNVRGQAALLSPATGVVDFREVARAMARDIDELGGRVITRSQARSIRELAGPSGEVVVGSDTGEYRTRKLVVCAGLQADRVAAMGGLTVDFQVIPFRGEYYQLPHDRSDVVQRLIYPVPDPGLPFLGVHLSPTIDGRITVGPNAVLGFSRERHPRGSVTARDVAEYLTFPGMWRFAKSNIRTGVDEMRSSLFPQGYLELVRKYCPGLRLEDLRPYPAGIRAQAIMRDGTSVEDFLLRSTERQLHVCNAPSPAATSAIPIAGLITDKFATAA
ncbi:L-2-hydroxyglutarate oxidase [Promicromonospora umidemergens]|uniref:L-2-hydroxyglutarate oxidase n=1 Tax=Promicromonospora umidemergens TaxID=629679 RepID=A0ABP8Y4S4_9MICO|nr:L-2-hydroxyglutarate oxidase [Promicromonospora umidemergens]MCP2282543.1 L-2-hydroxyglutarate oxidase [Promicromonospora umidemergens]